MRYSTNELLPPRRQQAHLTVAKVEEAEDPGGAENGDQGGRAAHPGGRLRRGLGAATLGGARRHTQRHRQRQNVHLPRRDRK